MNLDFVGDLDDEIASECIWDLDQQIEYIGSPNLVVYYNKEKFILDDFDKGRIQK